MIVTIHQPDYLPWLGFFDRWHQSDLFIVLDDVQFLRRGWHHRDRIKTANGPDWITVPVIKKNRYEQRIRDVELDDGSWRRKHLAMIRAAYAKAPHFPTVFPLLAEVYARKQVLLVQLTMDLLEMAADLLDIRTPVVLASAHDLGLTEGPDCRGTQRLIRLCQIHGATTYLTGTGSRSYLDVGLFRLHGLNVRWQCFEHPVYPQLHGDFEPNLSVLDYLMSRETPQTTGTGSCATGT